MPSTQFRRYIRTHSKKSLSSPLLIPSCLLQRQSLSPVSLASFHRHTTCFRANILSIITYVAFQGRRMHNLPLTMRKHQTHEEYFVFLSGSHRASKSQNKERLWTYSRIKESGRLDKSTVFVLNLLKLVSVHKKGKQGIHDKTYGLIVNNR